MDLTEPKNVQSVERLAPSFPAMVAGSIFCPNIDKTVKTPAIEFAYSATLANPKC